MNYLSALVGPFFLLLIEGILPYPYFFEEIYKFFLVRASVSNKTAFLLGLFFSFSESVFYFFNPNFSVLNISSSLTRFLATTPMHILTILIMKYFNEKSLFWLGLTLAILIHYLFNLANMPNLNLIKSFIQ